MIRECIVPVLLAHVEIGHHTQDSRQDRPARRGDAGVDGQVVGQRRGHGVTPKDPGKKE